MADLIIGTGSNLAVKLWAERAEHEALKMTLFGKLASSSPDSALYIKDDLMKKAGDRITCTLGVIPTGAGISGDATLEGNEDNADYYTQNVLVDQLRNGLRWNGRITKQRTLLDFREEVTPKLRDWMADRIDAWWINHASGNTGQTDLKYVGFNATTAPTSAAGNTRIMYGNGTSTTENSLSVCSCAFKLEDIDRLVNQAMIATPAIEPVKTPSGMKYILVIHPNQARQLKIDATAGRVTWWDYHRSVIQGGGPNIIGNPEFGALGEYNNVIIHENSRIPLAPSTVQIRRSVFLGRQGVLFAFGRDYSLTRFRMDEKDFDYGNKPGMDIGIIGGCVKPVYNSIDYGTIVLSTSSPNT